jgi:putative ABC transport system permease protein
VLRIALAGLRAHKLRTVLSGLAVMIGVGLLGGSLIYSATARAAFYADLSRAGTGVDVAATPTDAPALTGPAALAAVAGLPDVAHVDGRVVAPLGVLGRNGRVITNDGSVGVAVSLPSWSGFARFGTVAGRLPLVAGEVALDRPTAEREARTLGDRIEVVNRGGQAHPMTVVGEIDFGADRDFADNSVVALTAPDLAGVAGPTTVDTYDQIVVAARPGVDPDRLRERVAAVLGPGYTVVTGDQLRHDLAGQTAKYVDAFLTTLLATTLVTLVVAGLVVFNTFRVVLAGRTRELALLRCVGARRTQLATLVLAESLGVGVVASLCALLVSVAVGEGLLVTRRLKNHDLPPAGLVVPGSAIALVVVTGVTLTVACGVLPAILAGRVAPLAALRTSDDVVVRPARHPVLAVLAALPLTAAGLLLVRAGRDDGFDGLVPIAGGAMMGFVALVIVLPFLVRPFLRLVLRVVNAARLGPTAQLAAANAARNPIRFAVMSTALMVGIAPLTMFAVMLTTARVQAQRELAENFPIDFVVEHADTGSARPPLPATLIERAHATRSFAAVVLGHAGPARADGVPIQVGAFEPGTLGVSVGPEVTEGSLTELQPGALGLQSTFAAAHDLALGDVVELDDDGGRFAGTVAVIFDDTPLPVDVLVDAADYEAHQLVGRDYLMIRRAAGVDVAQARAVLDDIVADDPLAVVSSTAQRRDALAASLEGRLVQFDVLLGLSLLIGLAGVANTLALSVLERRRESALLRALGLGVRQLRATLLVEALLVALLGAGLGVGFGVGFGWLAADGLIRTYGHGHPAVPLGQIGAYLGLVGLAAALASILPGRRAARLAVITALADE